MSYHFSVLLPGQQFDEAIDKVTEALKRQGFGILTEIDVQQTFKNKLDLAFRKYRILGACNPNFAHQAISAEPRIGVFLPCNVVVQEDEKGHILISAVDPVASMVSVNNPALESIAGEVQHRLALVIEEMKEWSSVGC